MSSIWIFVVTLCLWLNLSVTVGTSSVTVCVVFCTTSCDLSRPTVAVDYMHVGDTAHRKSDCRANHIKMLVSLTMNNLQMDLGIGTGITTILL